MIVAPLYSMPVIVAVTCVLTAAEPGLAQSSDSPDAPRFLHSKSTPFALV